MSLITRAQWGAKPAGVSRNKMVAKPLGITIHWEGPRMGTRSHSQCASLIRGIQAFHMGPSRGWVDIGYSLLVCEHGYVYEGRGKGIGQAAQGTTYGNEHYYSICCLVGKGDPQTPALIKGIQEAANIARSWGAGNAVTGHRDFVSTECPGADLYAKAKAGVFSRKTPAVIVKPIVDKVRQSVSRKPVLRVGSNSKAVLNLQRGLLRVFPAYAGPIRQNGGPITRFGPATRRVVMEFQRRVGLPATGVVEAKTWAKLSRYGIKP